MGSWASVCPEGQGPQKAAKHRLEIAEGLRFWGQPRPASRRRFLRREVMGLLCSEARPGEWVLCRPLCLEKLCGCFVSV